MEEIKDFESFYNIHLQPSLRNLKLQSNDVSGWSIGVLLSLMFAIFCFLLQQIMIAMLFVILAIFCIYKYSKKRKLFIASYKEIVITEIINYLNRGMSYKPHESIAPVDYEKSCLYRKTYEYYKGSDLITGTYNGVKFYCSELETGYDRSSGSGGNQTTIFKGLFFAAPLKIYFPGAIYVWPAGEEQLAQILQDEDYRLFPLPVIYHISINNSIFENSFSMFSSNPSEALSIADQALMERLIKFKNNLQKDIRLSIVNSICYVSISIDKELLKPSVLNPDNKEKIKDYFFNVQLIFEIISQLDLKRFV